MRPTRLDARRHPADRAHALLATLVSCLSAVAGCTAGQARNDAEVAEDAASAGTGGGPGGTASGGQGSATGGTSGSTGSAGSGGAPGGSGGQPGDAGSTAAGGNPGGRGGVASSGGIGGGRGGAAGSGTGGSGGAAGTGTAGSTGAAGAPGGGPVPTTTQHLDIGVHDPSMIWDGQRYALFATGGKLSMRTSPNLQKWTDAGRIFSSTPAWITTALGTEPADLWAPDVSFFNGTFHVYYAGSTFGSNLSVIGLATNVSLDPAAAGYKWTDQGLVVQSKKSDNFNAIDPNVAFDDTDTPWLAFGSFWTGIKLRKLDRTTGKLAADDPTVYALAARGNGGAIEAASIIFQGGFYYLFVSFDACCKGVDSTYRTMVGRAAKITGPYMDKAGKGMSQGAAEELLTSSGRYIGPGGGTAFRNGDVYLYAFHYYDGQANGASKLQIRPIAFSTDGWPMLGQPIFP